MPYKIDEIHAIANRYEIPIIEDSAEALESNYKGKKCGTLVTHSDKLKEKAIFYATQSRDNAPHYEHS